MAFCQIIEERKRRCLDEEETRVGIELVIITYGIPLASVTFFNYLGRVILAEYNNWPAVIKNLWRARQKMVRLTKVLII